MTSHVISKPASMSRVAVVAAAALLLGGCAGGALEPAASPDITQSAAASVSASPTPTATAAYRPADAHGPAVNVPVPVLPPEAKKRTKEGLEAFSRYWYSTLSYAYETGDMGPLEAISGSTCKSCAKVKEVVEGWHSDGRWLEGGRMTVLAAQSKFIEVSPNQYQVILMVRQEPLSYYNPDKTLDEATAATPAVGDIMVAVYTDKGWVAETVEHLVNDR